jgi:magnesium transporter
MGIVLTEDVLITVCLKDSPIFSDFSECRVKGFDTRKKTRFILQLLYRNASRFLLYLKQIDRASTRVQAQLTKSTKNKELIQLLSLEKSLVYFSTSLASNEMVLEKLMKVDYIKKYPDDIDLLGDVIVENKQAIEMCNIYRDILSGTMDAFASVISNNLNIVMKFMAGMTIVLTIPTVIASIWGMNVPVPYAGDGYGFWVILGMIALATGLVILWLKKKKMF